MPRIRTRRDGVRELKVDDELHEIPHDHELAPNPTFSYAYREAFFVHPRYMSVSRSDMACADAFVALAAAHDLTVMGQRLGPDLKQLLDPAIQKLRDVALASTSAATVKHLQERLTELSTPKIEASTGPEFGDDVWYAGTGKTEDDEIERNLEAPFDGADVDDDVYTEVERVDVCSSNYHLLTRYRSAVDLQPSPSVQIATMSAGSRIRREVIATSTTGRKW